MPNLENELKDLRENNIELVKKMQFWKMTAAQREKENFALMKEVTELRLKLSRLRNGGDKQAHKLEAALQGASEEVLSHLVQASNAVARTMEFVKTYMHERQELESSLPRWSSISDSHSAKKINKVRPMLIGGRTVQPFVLLNRTLDAGNHTAVARQNQSHNVTERAIPMQMLLDVYIPLRRIDADDLPANNEDNDNHGDDSAEGLALEEAEDRTSDAPLNMTEGETFEESRHLDAVSEEAEAEPEEAEPEEAEPEEVEPEEAEPEEEEWTLQRPQADNPLEGPSWLLDRSTFRARSKCIEHDSTADTEGVAGGSAGPSCSINKVKRNSQQNGQKSPTEPGPSAGVPRTLGPPELSAPPGSALPLGEDTGFSLTVRRRRLLSPATGSCRTSPHPRQRSRNSQQNGQKSPTEPGPSAGVPRTLGPPERSAPPGSALPLGKETVFSHVFSPTVRRRRPPSPATSPDCTSPHPRQRSSDAYNNGGRILKVLVPKIRVDDCPPRGTPSPVARRAVAQAAPSPTLLVRARAPVPHKRRLQDSAPVETPTPPKKPIMRFDAPSPNGATDARVIVMESNSSQPEPCSSGMLRATLRRKRLDSQDSQRSTPADSDSDVEMLAERRPRRQKKAVVYKEKPLNRKMRR